MKPNVALLDGFVPQRHSGSKSREGIETLAHRRRARRTHRVTAGRKAEKALKQIDEEIESIRDRVTAGRKAEKALKQCRSRPRRSRRDVTAGRKAEKALKPCARTYRVRFGVTAGRKAEKALKHAILDVRVEMEPRHSGSKSREGIETWGVMHG